MWTITTPKKNIKKRTPTKTFWGRCVYYNGKSKEIPYGKTETIKTIKSFARNNHINNFKIFLYNGKELTEKNSFTNDSDMIIISTD
jgi:hypothetical protein